MTDAIEIDVVIPVWNRPNETRNCLVNVINNTPGARLIMYDCGSERDTERLLQEFADSLEDRALLMRDDTNIGFVPAANRGLLRAEAPYLALVRSTTQVCAGWIEPLLQFAAAHPEAGILLPCLTPGVEQVHAPMEVEQGSFAAMVISRKAYQRIGGFDEAMDNGLWCLRDYTRRACANGFLTYRIPTPPVEFEERVPLGSEQRRKERLERSIATFRERWGKGRNYIVHAPKGMEPGLLREKLEWMVKGARHGDTYTVLVHQLLYKEAQSAGLDRLHENVRLVPLPRLALDLNRRRVFERQMAQTPGAIPVTAVDGIPFPWSPSYLSFTDLMEKIKEQYGRGGIIQDESLQEG